MVPSGYVDISIILTINYVNGQSRLSVYTPLLFTLAIFLGGSLLAPNNCELPEARSAKLHK